MRKDFPSVNPLPTEGRDIVSSLLVAQGVSDHKWGQTIASIIGVHYTTAQRLLANEERFELGQLRLIAAHFGTTLAAMLNEPTIEAFGTDTFPGQILFDSDVALPCRFTVSKSHNQPCPALVAYMQNDEYFVSPPSLCPPGVFTQAVSTLFLADEINSRESLPMIAVLDDVAPKALVHFLRSEGFNAEAFTEPEALIARIETGNNRPDAYILDWSLKHGQTALPVIQAIRSVSKDCPILLLSGTIQRNEGAIGDAVTEYGIEVNVKPSMAPILSRRLAVLLKNRRPAAIAQ